MKFPITFLILSLFMHNLYADSFYEEPQWTPRVGIGYDDIIQGDFWPKSPTLNVNFEAPGFDDSKLSELPAPGEHPRVLMTIQDVEKIREKIALGDQASQEFQTLWAREKKSKSAFYALAVQDHELGKSKAKNLMERVRRLPNKLDELDKQADTENIWSVIKSATASGGESPAEDIWSLLDYDYLHQWFNEEEREEVREIIARITARRISNYMIVPDHFMINNHQGFGMAYKRLLLLIEGQEGFNKELYKVSEDRVFAKLDWFLNEDGMCFETIKGWLNSNAIVATGLRNSYVLKHSHLRAKMKFFLAALHWQDGKWRIRDEMYMSAFHVIWMMRYYYPEDETLDLLYQASLNSHESLTNIKSRWRSPVGMTRELMLLYADGEVRSKKDWSQNEEVEKLGLPLTWADNTRGYVYARNSWDKEDLQFSFSNKQDFFYGGHEGSETNRFILWSDGVNWARDTNMLRAKATFLQNMLTVDGKGLKWPPAPGIWLGYNESKHGLTAAGDGAIGYSYSKKMQVHSLDSASGKTPYFKPFTEKNYYLTRDLQVAFHPETIKFNDGYAHTDYGPWSGETRLVEHYMENNPMKQAYRTAHMAKGKHPYVLIIDDANKDGMEHLYEWNMTLPEDVDLYEAQTPEIKYQTVEAQQGRQNDLILTRPNTPRDPKTGDFIIKKGDPMCLVRVLWRNSPHGFPIPSFRRFDGTPEKPYKRFSHISIPAISESPEFRILIYPYKHGEPMPETSWNSDRTELEIKIGKQLDVYQFGQTDGGRTVLTMLRNEKTALQTSSAPERPVLKVYNTLFDINDARGTRKEEKAPHYPFKDTIALSFVKVEPPAKIHYTLDGNEPTIESPVYTKPLQLDKSGTIKAIHYNPNWIGSHKSSEIIEATVEKVEPSPATMIEPKGSKQGVLVQVYEKATYMWDDHGFFRAGKIMLPNLDEEEPVYSHVMADMSLPLVNPKNEQVKQVKGFYRLRGWLYADKSGTYDLNVHSCGPVLLKIAGQNAIESIGIFHQQLADRSGYAVLEKGWNAFDLIICDPQYWNMTTMELMPFKFSYGFEGGALQEVPSDKLRYSVKFENTTPVTVEWLKPHVAPKWLEFGAIKSQFDRVGMRDNADYLDIRESDAINSIKTEEFETNYKADTVYSYDGWFYAPEDGIYSFTMPNMHFRPLTHGQTRAAYQSQLRLGSQVVLQKGVFGRNPSGSIGLQVGWYPISLRVGDTPITGAVEYPDGSELKLSKVFQRESKVRIQAQGIQEQMAYEIYEATNISLALPDGKEGEIRYTLDGSSPTKDSRLYQGSLTIKRSGTLKASAFVNGLAITSPAVAKFSKLDIPQSQKIFSVNFSDEKSVEEALKNNSKGNFIISPNSYFDTIGGVRALAGNLKKTKEHADIAVNLVLSSNSKPAFEVTHFNMKQDALTIGLWFKPAEELKGHKELFSKTGYTAFGKSIRTIKARITWGRPRVDPGIVFSGKKINEEEWNFIVITADRESIHIYQDGELVAQGKGTKQIRTDAFDFMSKFQSYTRYACLYNRVLSKRDIEALYRFIKN